MVCDYLHVYGKKGIGPHWRGKCSVARKWFRT